MIFEYVWWALLKNPVIYHRGERRARRDLNFDNRTQMNADNQDFKYDEGDY